MFRYTTPSLVRTLFPSLVWKLPVNEQEVFLTFDDGPHPEITPWVCDLLDKYGAKATFFCVGENVKRYPETFDMLLRRGHSVGNHTFHHKNGWKTPDQEYFSDIRECNELVRSKLFRPPYGRISLSQLKKLKNEYRIIMWSSLSRDFEVGLDKNEAMPALKKSTQPGSIVVFHDSIKAEQNLKALLPEYLDFCRTEGFRLKNIPWS